MNEIDLQTILDRSGVQPPYWAFKRVSGGADGVTASFIPEHQMEDEIGPALSLRRKRGDISPFWDPAQPHPLLMRDASITWLLRPHSLVRSAGSELEATAEIVNLDRRQLKASAVLSAGVPIFTLDCTYKILTAALFEKFYGGRRHCGNLIVTESPYRMPIPFGDLTELPGGLATTCGPVDENACAGHFPNFAAWPVAVVMHSLSRLAGRALQKDLGRPCSYSVVRAEIEADTLAFSSEVLQLKTTRIFTGGCDHHYHCFATSGERTVGEMKLELQEC